MHSRLRNSGTIFAPKYAKSPIKDVPAYEYTLGRTRSYLKPTDAVLELGCGTGGTALKLADAVAHLDRNRSVRCDAGRRSRRGRGT